MFIHCEAIRSGLKFNVFLAGFLKTGAKGSAQGNFGLMDLVAGLHWLRENLPAFGGDPQRVTLMGHGTGAALANFLSVSPVARGTYSPTPHLTFCNQIFQTRRDDRWRLFICSNTSALLKMWKFLKPKFSHRKCEIDGESFGCQNWLVLDKLHSVNFYVRT